LISRAQERPGFFLAFFYPRLRTAASLQPQLNRLPGRGAQDEPAPLSLPLGPPQEKADIIRWGFAAPHLGQLIFGSFSETPWIISNE